VINDKYDIYYQVCNSIIGKKEILTNVKTKIYKTVHLPTLIKIRNLSYVKHKSRVIPQK
jgi:hypothetical protein